MYVMKKVFDCQDMPADVKTHFFEVTYSGTGNWSYESHEVVYSSWYDDDTNTDILNDEYTILDAWLLENGAHVCEYVLIHRWW